MNQTPSSGPAGGVAFATTHLPATSAPTAGGIPSPLADLCRDYWIPLYGFVRGRSYEIPIAQEILRDFVAELAVGSAAGAGGSARPFLLASLKYHLFRRQDRAPIPDSQTVEIAFPTDAEVRRAEETFAVAKPTTAAIGEDQLFEWRWADALVRRAWDKLPDKYAASGRRESLATLRPFITGGIGVPTVADAARQMGVTPAEAEADLTQLRSNYREALRREAARTVDRAEQVSDELRQLCRALAVVPSGA